MLFAFAVDLASVLWYGTVHSRSMIAVQQWNDSSNQRQREGKKKEKKGRKPSAVRGIVLFIYVLMPRFAGVGRHGGMYVAQQYVAGPRCNGRVWLVTRGLPDTHSEYERTCFAEERDSIEALFILENRMLAPLSA